MLSTPSRGWPWQESPIYFYPYIIIFAFSIPLTLLSLFSLKHSNTASCHFMWVSSHTPSIHYYESSLSIYLLPFSQNDQTISKCCFWSPPQPHNSFLHYYKIYHNLPTHFHCFYHPSSSGHKILFYNFNTWILNLLTFIPCPRYIHIPWHWQ